MLCCFFCYGPDLVVFNVTFMSCVISKKEIRTFRTYPIKEKGTINGRRQARKDFWNITGHKIIVITFNSGSNFMCLKKGHSEYHSNVSTLSGGQMRHRMYCWKVGLTIIGTSRVT